MEIVLNHRVASYPNLLHLPVLYNIIAGGQSWAHSVAAKFPLEPTLLFHASFGIAVANSIVFLGATLKDRKLMTLRQWLLLQVVVLVSGDRSIGGWMGGFFFGAARTAVCVLSCASLM